MTSPESCSGLFDRPVFIVSTPRSGSTLLFETLAQAPDLFTVGGESHRLIEADPQLSPRGRGWDSNRLEAKDATPEVAEELAQSFYERLRDRAGNAPAGPVRMLEKTPKNALRVPFITAVWPDAQFVYLYRDVRETLASMLEAWQSGRFRTYPRLPNWRGEPWSLLLVPGWEELSGLPLEQVVARQWATTTSILLDDLAKLDPRNVRALDYRAFLTGPQAELERLAGSLELRWDRTLGESLPHSKTTVSRPEPDKWRRVEPAVEAMMPLVADADARAREFLELQR